MRIHYIHTPNYGQRLDTLLKQYGAGTIIEADSLFRAMLFIVLILGVGMVIRSNPVPSLKSLRKDRSPGGNKPIFIREYDQSLLWLIWYGTCLFVSIFITSGLLQDALNQSHTSQLILYVSLTSLSFLISFLIALFFINQFVCQRIFCVLPDGVHYLNYVFFKKTKKQIIPYSEYKGVLLSYILTGYNFGAHGRWEIWLYARNPEYNIALDTSLPQYEVSMDINTTFKRPEKSKNPAVRLVHSKLRIVRPEEGDYLKVPPALTKKLEEYAQQIGIQTMKPAFIWEIGNQILFPEAAIDESPVLIDQKKARVAELAYAVPVLVVLAAAYFKMYAELNHYDSLLEPDAFLFTFSPLGALVGMILTFTILPQTPKKFLYIAAVTFSFGFLFWAMGLYYNGALDTSRTITREAIIVSKNKRSVFGTPLREHKGSPYFLIDLKYKDSGESASFKIYDFKKYKEIKSDKSYVRIESKKGYFGFSYRLSFQMIHPEKV